MVEFVGCRLLGFSTGAEGFLRDIVFRDCALQLAKFRFATCKAVRFEDCILEEADFQGADLAGVVFRNCDLRRAEMSGVTLAGFLCIHVGAVQAARVTGTDTNLHFAAAGMQSGLWALFFAPYYTAAVTALGLHTGIALRRRTGQHWAFPLLTAAGLALGIGLVLLMAGLIHDYTVPQEWRAAFG